MSVGNRRVIALETEEKIRAIERDEVREALEDKWDELGIDFDESGYWYDVPAEIDIAQTSLAQIIRYEKNRLMNLAHKAEHYYLRGEGWNDVRSYRQIPKRRGKDRGT